MTRYSDPPHPGELALLRRLGDAVLDYWAAKQGNAEAPPLEEAWDAVTAAHEAWAMSMMGKEGAKKRMIVSNDRTREKCSVGAARLEYEEDRRIYIVLVMCEFPDAAQGFQATFSDDSEGIGKNFAYIMAAEIARFFQVDSLEEVKDLECFALRSWPSWGEDIEGFEIDGRRWTKSGFTRRHRPEHRPIDLVEERARNIRECIGTHANWIQREVRALATIREGFVDWSEGEKAP